MNLRKNLLTFISNNKCKIGSPIAKQCLEKVKNYLIEANAERHVKNVKDHINEVKRENGSVSQLELWKLKSKIIYNETQVPDFMGIADICSVCKKKGSKNDLKNDRGIFLIIGF